MNTAQQPYTATPVTTVDQAAIEFQRVARHVPLTPHRFASRIVTAAHTCTGADDVVLANATGGAFSVSLPDAIDLPGRRFTVVRTNAGANAVTVGAGNVLGGNIALGAQYAYATVQSCLTTAPATYSWVRTS